MVSETNHILGQPSRRFGYTSVLNSTTTNISNGETLGLSFEDVDDFAIATFLIYSDVDVTLHIDIAPTAVAGNLVRTKSFPIIGLATPQVHTLTIVSKYVRCRVANASGAATTEFSLQTRFHKTQAKHLTTTLDATITTVDDVELTRSILVGATDGGTYKNVKIANEGGLRFSQPLTAFGEIKAEAITPVVQVDFPYNINLDIVGTTVTGSGTVTQANSSGVCSTTAATASTALLTTDRYIKYKPGEGALARFTGVFTTGVTGSQQYIGGFDSEDGFAFGYNGSVFGVLHRNNTVDTWIPQTSWNIDTMDGDTDAENPSGVLLDPTKGNVYQVAFQYLGYGAVVYSVEVPSTGEFTPVHRIQYANANTVPALSNPSFPLAVYVENTTNNTNIVASTGSMAGFIEGRTVILGPRNSIQNTKNVGTTLTNIVTIQNKATYQGIANRVPVRMSSFSAALDGTKVGDISLIVNATLAGTPSYTDISADASVVSYDTAGTTVTGGNVLETISLGKVDSERIPLLDQNLDLFPGDTLTLAAKVSGATSDASGALNWIEDF